MPAKLFLTLLLCFASLHHSESMRGTVMTKCCQKNNVDIRQFYDVYSPRPKITFCCAMNDLEVQEICTETFSRNVILPTIYKVESDIKNPQRDFSFHSAMDFDIIFQEHPTSYYDLPNPEKNEDIFLLENGTLLVHNLKTSSYYTLDYKDFCLVNILAEDGPQVIVHGLYTSTSEIDSGSRLSDGNNVDDYDVPDTFKTSGGSIDSRMQKTFKDKALQIALWIDVFFLVATLLVIALLPERRNVHEVLLMTYVFCLCISTSLLALMKSTELVVGSDLWVILACVEYFFFLAGVFWMHVMSSDMRCSISKINGSSLSTDPNNQNNSITYSIYNWGYPTEQKKRIKFVFYSIYAWGSALFITRLCLQKNFFPGISTYPKSESEAGFSSDDYDDSRESSEVVSTLNFLLSVILIYSIFLVITAVWRIHAYNKNPENEEYDSVRQGVHNDNKHRLFRFSLYSKLFIVTGINWTLEIISFIFTNDAPQYIWIIPNFFNALQGLFIFAFIFSHRKVRQSFMEVICCSNSGIKMQELTEESFNDAKKPPIFSNESHKEDISVVVAQYEKILDGK